MSEMSPSAETIHDQPLADALSERYLAYALSTIVSRSLPDVRDGLKPVHRRLLYAMRLLKLDPAGGFKKCARVVGDVIGKYHPHGDGAVYDALVRLAQDFAVRYPLVEGQGNFGNIDGDGAAAMRYTESRLTSVAQALMQGLDEDAVDFRETYDGEESEPVVMPAAFPNLLANGSSGIAVGMATNIPPHNIVEVCEALLALIKRPDTSIEDLLFHVKGPDFPTGGILVEDQKTIQDVYNTGRGGLRLRARWFVETLSHGLFQIVVIEIPYQVQKSKVIERIASLLTAKKLPLLADVRDESAEDVRVILEPRSRSIDPDMLMEQLFQQTDLEIRFSLNMNVLDADGTPRVMSLKDVLQAFLNHRIVVLQRRTTYRLDKIAHRLEVLAGYLVAYLNLDEVICIIREEDEAKAVLMQHFSLSEIQADSILNMRLRSLRKLEEMEIRREHDALSQERGTLEALLNDSSLQWRDVARQVSEIKKSFGAKNPLGMRRTDITGAPSDIIVPLEAVVEKEPITILLSEKGWLRAVKGHVDDASDLRFKDGDGLSIALHVQTTDKILMCTNQGRFYTLTGDRIPRGRGFGEPLRLFLDVPDDAIVVNLVVHEPGRELLVVASSGRGFRVCEDHIIAQTRAGKQVMTPGQGESMALCIPACGDTLAIVGQNRRMLIFDLKDVPLLARGRGVILQKYKGGGVSDAHVFFAADGLTFQSGERVRTETNLMPWRGARAGQGRIPPIGFPRNNRFWNS